MDTHDKQPGVKGLDWRLFQGRWTAQALLPASLISTASMRFVSIHLLVIPMLSVFSGPASMDWGDFEMMPAAAATQATKTLPWSTERSQVPDGVRVHTSPGLLYSTKEGVEAPGGSLNFWLFHRSKKVWFRLDPTLYGQPIPHVFTYRGRPIRFSGDQAKAEPSTLSGFTPAILWNKHLQSGWGQGPKHTNFFLSILTRWSLWHLAGSHPSEFRVTYWREAPPTGTPSRGRVRQN